MYLAAFPQRGEYEKMRASLDSLGLSYRIVPPEPAYSLVGCPAIVMDHDTCSHLMSTSSDCFVCSGWIDYRPPTAASIPEEMPPSFPDDLFGSASIMVLAPCIADQTKIRLIAHISGDMTGAVYNPEGLYKKLKG